MGEKIIEKLLELSPQLGLVVLFLVALALLLKEYRTLRGEMKAAVDDAVGSRVGAILGNLQAENAKASEILRDTNRKYAQAQSFLADLEKRLGEREQSIGETLSDLESKLAILQRATPKSRSIKYSARDLAAVAQHARSLGEAVALIEEAQNDPDATSKDLEIVGDTARRFRRYTLAKDLYRKATERDPENLSARVELLALIAETEPANRQRSLDDARQLVLSSLDPNLLGRVANVHFEIGRYAELQSFCEGILAKEPPEDSDVYVQAHRDLGAALKAQKLFDEAEKHFQVALLHDAEDENLLTAYVGLLRDRKQPSRALTIAKTLLSLDPLAFRYYVILARIHSDLGQHDEAARWYEKAEELVEPGSAEHELAVQENRKARLRTEFGLGQPAGGVAPNNPPENDAQ